MRSKSTDKMKMIKEYAENYYRIHHASPSIRTIAEGTGISRASVQRYLVEIRGGLPRPQSIPLPGGLPRLRYDSLRRRRTFRYLLPRRRLPPLRRPGRTRL